MLLDVSGCSSANRECELDVSEGFWICLDVSGCFLMCVYIFTYACFKACLS